MDTSLFLTNHHESCFVSFKYLESPSVSFHEPLANHLSPPNCSPHNCSSLVSTLQLEWSFFESKCNHVTTLRNTRQRLWVALKKTDTLYCPIRPSMSWPCLPRQPHLSCWTDFLRVLQQIMFFLFYLRAITHVAPSAWTSALKLPTFRLLLKNYLLGKLP